MSPKIEHIFSRKSPHSKTLLQLNILFFVFLNNEIDSIKVNFEKSNKKTV